MVVLIRSLRTFIFHLQPVIHSCHFLPNEKNLRLREPLQRLAAWIRAKGFAHTSPTSQLGPRAINLTLSPSFVLSGLVPREAHKHYGGSLLVMGACEPSERDSALEGHAEAAHTERHLEPVGRHHSHLK